MKPAPAPEALPPVVLVCGDDEFTVKQRARQIFQQWSDALDGLDREIIDGSAANSGEALTALARLNEALQTLPFFGGGKVVWLQNCNFLGDERAANAKAVTERLAELAADFKNFPWGKVRLLCSAGKVDKRKTFYKTLEKIGKVETFAGWSADDRDWAMEAENAARGQLRTLKKSASAEALARLVAYVGPNQRQLNSEVEKLALFTGERAEVETEDVEAITVRNKQSRAFALGDAFGSRDLPKLLRTLDQELWEMRTDSQKSEIGLLYGLISKVRVMIFLKEMQREGLLKSDNDYNRFKAQLERVPAGLLPEDRKFNPLAMNPYVLFKSLEHARKYSLEELVQAMELLLECNQSLVLSGMDEAIALQQTLAKIVSRKPAAQLN